LPSTVAIEKTVAKKALQKINELKSMDMSDVMCDECLEEIDCIWPCELACILDYPVDYAGKVCQICLEYFGCTGCKFMCPTPTTPSPSSAPTGEPSTGPTAEPTGTPTTGPTTEPTLNPAPQPTGGPTPYPTSGPTIQPSGAPSAEPTTSPTTTPSTAPTTEPTSVPTTSPTRVPYPGPTFVPTSAPTGEPTSLPTPVPSITPSSAPTIPPTIAPTTTPEFWIYYSAYDKELYSFNPIQGGTTYLIDGDFSGDMKIDSVNKFMFYSSPNKGGITKFDLTNQATGSVIEDYTGVMGIACDPSRGELYFADQGNMAIMIVDYAGSNYSIVHDLAAYAMIPYGMDVSPAATVSDFNLNDPGIIFFTGFDDYYGYIVQANLFGGKMEVVYTSTSKALYGIVMDTTYEMLWWLEDRGVANGLYCSMFSGNDQSYVSYLQNSYWIAALWSLEMMYTCDYDAGVVYELDVNMQSGEIVDTSAIAYVDQPRIIGYYYNIDADETLSSEVETEISEDVAVDADATDATEDTEEVGKGTAESNSALQSTKQGKSTTKSQSIEQDGDSGASTMEGMPSFSSHSVKLAEEDTSSEGSSNLSMMGFGGILAVAGIVGLVSFLRKRSDDFSPIASTDAI